MSSENKIQLINNGLMQIAYGSTSAPHYDLFANAVLFNQPLILNGDGSDSYVTALFNYLNVEKQKLHMEPYSRTALLWMDVKVIDVCYQKYRFDFEFGLAKTFSDTLCKIFHLPSIEIKGSIQGQYGAALAIPVNMQINLKGLMNSVNTNKNGKVFQTFTIEGENYHSGRFTFEIYIRWDEHVDETILLDRDTLLENLFDNEPTKDLLIVSGSGATVKCHKMVFAAQSKAFSSMLLPATGMRESQTGKVELKDNSEDGIKLLLRYLYGLGLSTKNISCGLTVELFQTAHKYDLLHLEDSLHEFLLQKDRNWFSPGVILELYFYIKNITAFKTLKDHVLDIMTRMNTKDLSACAEFKKLSRAAAVELLCTLVMLLQA